MDSCTTFHPFFCESIKKMYDQLPTKYLSYMSDPLRWDTVGYGQFMDEYVGVFSNDGDTLIDWTGDAGNNLNAYFSKKNSDSMRVLLDDTIYVWTDTPAWILDAGDAASFWIKYRDQSYAWAFRNLKNFLKILEGLPV